MRPGQSIDVEVGAFPDRVFKGVITFISPTVDPATRTLRIKAEIENEQGHLRPGLFARVSLGVSPRSGVVMVPEEALIQRSEGAVLFKIMFPIPGVRDYTCGYRAYRAGLLQEVTAADPGFFDQDGFQVMVDILLKLRRNRDLIFGEVPLILRYDLKEGSSKMDVGATIVSTLGLMWRRRFA